MTPKEIKVNDKVYFINEKIPFLIMARNKRYAIAVRKLNRREDANLLKYKVEMGGYSSFTEAYIECKDLPIYTIIDFKLNVRGSDNMVFGIFDYFDRKDCEKAIKYLESGEMEISNRNRVNLEFKE